MFLLINVIGDYCIVGIGDGDYFCGEWNVFVIGYVVCLIMIIILGVVIMDDVD